MSDTDKIPLPPKKERVHRTHPTHGPGHGLCGVRDDDNNCGATATIVTTPHETDVTCPDCVAALDRRKPVGSPDEVTARIPDPRSGSERRAPPLDYLSVEEARARSVCRICREPVHDGDGTVLAGYGNLVFDFGKEHAHENCLIKAGLRHPRVQGKPKDIPPPVPGGKRFNAGKTRFDLIPGPGALSEVANVSTFGMLKYDAHNWRKGLSWMDCARAVLSHTWKWVTGEERDPESGCLHMAHAAWNALVLVEMSLCGKRYIEFDDRRKDLAPMQGTENIKEPPRKLSEEKKT